METTLSNAYQYVQDIFRRGLVTVVGSGASCAYGLPSMGDLSGYLTENVPSRLTSTSEEIQTAWAAIGAELSQGVDLESALSHTQAPVELVQVITSLVTECVEESEERAIVEILRNSDKSPYGRLFEHMLSTSDAIDVITTNYDRLIEVHAARAGVRIDSMFFGHTIGRLDGQKSREELYQRRPKAGFPKQVNLSPRPHLRLSKPHGSLDWFTHDGVHYRSDLRIPGERRLVAPGASKYKIGYEPPFDVHRTRANDAIDSSSALLFIGYGFNDEHLQTHIRDKFPQVPVLILSHTLTTRALEYLSTNPRAIGIDGGESNAGPRLIQGDTTLRLETPLWNLENLLQEVLQI